MKLRTNSICKKLVLKFISENVKKIVVDGAELISDQEIANAFNKFFVNAGKNVAESIHPTSFEADDFLKEKIGRAHV